jgi:hypothetical protein
VVSELADKPVDVFRPYVETVVELHAVESLQLRESISLPYRS